MYVCYYDSLKMLCFLLQNALLDLLGGTDIISNGDSLQISQKSGIIDTNGSSNNQVHNIFNNITRQVSILLVI